MQIHRNKLKFVRISIDIFTIILCFLLAYLGNQITGAYNEIDHVGIILILLLISWLISKSLDAIKS